MKTFTEISQFIQEAKKRHPKIRAHSEDDWGWYNRGLTALRQGKTLLAMNTFQKVMLSQPEHSGGFEGLARVYFATGMPEAAQVLMDHACMLVKESIEQGETDVEILDYMDKFRQEIASAILKTENAKPPHHC